QPAEGDDMSESTTTGVSGHASEAPADADRRGSRRRRTHARLRLRLIGGSTRDAHMVDVSASGVQIELPTADDVPGQGQRLVLELIDDGDEAAPPRTGEVVW